MTTSTSSTINRISRSPIGAVMDGSTKLDDEKTGNSGEGEVMDVCEPKEEVVEKADNLHDGSTTTAMALKSPITPADLRAIDSRFVLPKCEVPPQKDMEVVSLFVSKAVREQHQNSGELSVPIEGYRAIGDAIRLQKDLSLLRKVLIALRTSALQYLTADTQKHARLIHLIVRFVPFPNSTMKTMLNADPLDETVDDFDLADAHLNLLTALVSANSLYVIPAMTALWKMLTFRITNSHTERYVIVLL